jgi:hypothetical protein
MTDTIEILIKEDPDYVNVKTGGKNSLDALLVRYPDGCSETTICKALNLHHTELQEVLKSALSKLRSEIV